MDAGYGASTDLRTDITALGLTYVAGILPNTTVRKKGEEPLRRLIIKLAAILSRCPCCGAKTK